MKITSNQLKLLGGLCFLVGAIVGIVPKYLNPDQTGESINHWKWIGIGIMILGFFFLMPWVKKKNT